MEQEKVEITQEHLAIMREKYNCTGMDDNDIIKAMLRYEKRFVNGAVWVLEAICFPSFQSYLDHVRTTKKPA